MTYKVVVLPAAQMSLERYIAYTKKDLKNIIAAKNIAKDARATKKRLSEKAPLFQFCPDEELAALGYRTIHFEHYDYFMVYRIEENIVYVDDMFHDLQDYESILLR